ncbi:MAG: sigma-54-dependent Fis family transcriptional regulator [Deltaproteobacteria bacterium]|nr:sigma-54-dependent Fis family transcriptional regulator [Deltaproteobacteria bacterium]
MTETPPRRLLFVEDDDAGREMGAFNLRGAGYLVDVAASGEQGLARFSAAEHDLVLTDLRLPGKSGLEVLRAVKQRAPEVPVLVITAFGSVEAAVEAMRGGAYDFIEKPFARDRLLLTVQRALEHRALRAEVCSLRRHARGVERPIVAIAEGMRRVLEIADRVAPSDASVLVTGETGTGKELVARRIHARSSRADGPLVVINCAAIPAELMESELFGHEKGAFTGAVRARPGRFRQADGGTVFLDEVAELPLALQGKLLRALQERVVDPVGADEPIAVDARVIAATNQDLARRVGEGLFREDLYYRLDTIAIAIPPLRQRREDIEPLARHFVAAFSGGRDLELGEPLLGELRSRLWPGNVRQLEHACERLVLLCPGGELRREDLPPVADGADGPSAGPEAGEWPALPEEGLGLVDLEKRVIERVLALKRGNVTQTAAYLRVPRHILAYRMAKYGIRRN